MEDQVNLEDAITLAKLFTSLSHQARIVILKNVDSYSLQQIAKSIGSSAPALQRHVNSLRERGFIEKCEGSYKLTDSGKQVIALFDQFTDLISRLKEMEKIKAKEKIRSVMFGSGLTDEDIKGILKELDEMKDEKK